MLQNWSDVQQKEKHKNPADSSLENFAGGYYPIIFGG